MKDIYIITGANGFLGNNIVRLLQNMDCEIRCLVRNNSDSLKGLKCKIYKGDVRDYNSLKDIFNIKENANVYVIHCASVVYIKKKYNQNVYDTNVNGSINIIKYTKKINAKLIYVSSVYSVLPKENNEVMSETYEFYPNLVNGLYAKTKSIINNVILSDKELNACIIFPSSLVGPNDYGKNFTNESIKLMSKVRLPITIKGEYDFVDVRDVSLAIINACKNSKHKCFLLTNKRYSIKDISNIVYNFTNKKEITKEINISLIKWITNVFETNLITKLSLETLETNSNFSHALATKELNYNPRDITFTIKDMLETIDK